MVLALCCAIGLHWIALHLWRDRHGDPILKCARIGQAIEQTDGAHCSLCHVVNKGTASVKKSGAHYLFRRSTCVRRSNISALPRSVQSITRSIAHRANLNTLHPLRRRASARLVHARASAPCLRTTQIAPLLETVGGPLPLWCGDQNQNFNCSFILKSDRNNRPRLRPCGCYTPQLSNAGDGAQCRGNGGTDLRRGRGQFTHFMLVDGHEVRTDRPVKNSSINSWSPATPLMIVSRSSSTRR